MDDVNLFDDAPPLKRCAGCGRYFEEQELKKCRVCGEYFCPECRQVHDCRVQNNAQKQNAQTFTPQSSPQAPVYVAPEITLDENKPDAVRASSYEYDAVPSPSSSYSYPQSETPYQQSQAPYSNSYNASPATPPVSADERVCDGCGRKFHKSVFRQCKKCGQILCPDCQKHHKCPSKKKQAKQSANASTYDSIMNYNGGDAKKKKKSKKILFIIFAVILLGAIAFVVLNLFGILNILPISGLLGGGVAGIGGTSIVGTWQGTYNGVTGTLTCQSEYNGFIKGEGFLGIPSAISVLTWSKDEATGTYIIASPMSEISATPVSIVDGMLTLNMKDGQQAFLTPAPA